MDRWERTIDGAGQVVLISGEVGIGKSHLVHRFYEQISGRPFNWVKAVAGPFFPKHTILPSCRNPSSAAGTA
jgi:predicted ATPase